MSPICIHATCVSLNGLGVLIRGPSGSGKSGLALQLLESVGTGLTNSVLKVEFVSDDQTELLLREGKIFASPPATIAGLLEIRGQEILRLPFLTGIPVVIVVDLKPAPDIERLAQLTVDILGVKLPLFEIDASHPSAASRLRVAFGRLQKA